MGEAVHAVATGTPVVAALVVLVAVLVAAAARPAGRLWLRRTMTALLTREQPHRRAEAAQFARRAVPLWRPPLGTTDLPADPFALTVPVVVPPWGDGRPGESFLAPRTPIVGTDELSVDGSRIDAQLPLAAGARFAVVCLGRVGALRYGRVLRPAQDRVGLRRGALPSGLWAAGAVTVVDCPAGTGWRQTFASERRTTIDTHLDHGGFAYVVGVSARDRPELAGVVDGVLATWRWLDDPAAAAAAAGDTGAGAEEPVHLPAEPAALRPGVAAAEVLVRVGGGSRPVAQFLAPAADSMPSAPWPATGQRTEALVALGPTAELVVVSEPLGTPAPVRVAERAHAPLGVTRDQDGPARAVTTAAGAGWRARYRQGGGFVSDEVELDHGGWAWTVVLACGPDDGVLAGVLDRALATWRWTD